MLAGRGDARSGKRRIAPAAQVAAACIPVGGPWGAGGTVGRLGKKAAGRPGDSFGPPRLLISTRKALPRREGGETPGPGLQKATGHRKGPQVPGLRGARWSPRLLAWWALLVHTAQTVEVFLVQPRAVCSTPEPRSRGSLSLSDFPWAVGAPTVPGCLSKPCPSSTYMIHRCQCT